MIEDETKARQGVMATPIRKAMGRQDGVEGSALVESALSISVLLTVMVGIMQLCLVMYASVFVSEAAREATRYASVRGANSCTDLATFPNCNLGPTSNTSNPNALLQTYLQGLGYPIPNRNPLIVSAKWWQLSQDPSTGYASWTIQCTTLNENDASGSPAGNGQPCNQANNMVTVRVNYSIPMYIPFWSNANVTLTSKSAMVIAN